MMVRTTLAMSGSPGVNKLGPDRMHVGAGSRVGGKRLALTIGAQWKQTRGLCPVEGERERVNESSHHPRFTDAALLSSILDLAPLSVIAWDGAGRIVLWNAEAERLLGWHAARSTHDAASKRARRRPDG